MSLLSGNPSSAPSFFHRSSPSKDPTNHYFVYQTSEGNSSTQFNMLKRFKKNMWWVMNVMNDGRWFLWCSNACLHSDSFNINTVKSQVNESGLVAQLSVKLHSLESDQKSD